MLRALRRRLALLLALLSALVLTLVAAAGLWLAWQQQTRAADLVFRSRFAALCDQLAVADLVTDGWLAARQLELGGVLDLADGGRPVHFSVRQRQDADLAALLDQAEGAALAAGLDPDAPAGEEPRQVDYSVTEPGGARWRGITAVLPRGGGALRLTALQPLAPAGPGWQLTLLAYGGLWLAGLAGLAAVSWLGAGRMLAPTRRAWQRQNEFVAAAGHELRSPLAVIKASLAAAEDPALPEAQRRGFLHTAQREADRLARLTGDLQLLAAGDAGALTVRPGPVAADTLCIEVYEQFYLLARAQGRRLTLQLPEAPLPPLVTDGGRLTQLLTILLQNALDHTPPGTPVELALQPAPGRLRLRVIDHGPGIPDDRKEQVFDRFFRADASRTRKENFGLGLSVARELARGLGAALTLADTPGGGATFTVDLPA